MKTFQETIANISNTVGCIGEGWAQMLKKISSRATEMVIANKEVKNDEIARAVLRSQPPFPADVPDMVDFNAKWGGGTSAFYVNDVLRFVSQSNVQPDVRVSGRTFKALADLKFGVDAVPAMAVNAVLKRIASSDKIIDGVASVYKPAEISSLATKHKAVFLEANKIMENAKKKKRSTRTR